MLQWPTDVPCVMQQATQQYSATCMEQEHHLQQPHLPPRAPHPGHVRWDFFTTPVHPQYLQAFLQNIPSASSLVSSFTYGFHIPHTPVHLSRISRNHHSAFMQQQFVDTYISLELHERHISGPFLSPPHPLSLYCCWVSSLRRRREPFM